MAHLSQKDGIHLIRFRFAGKEYKKSLKTRDAGSAQAALHIVELTIHRLTTGQTQLPAGINPGDFILSGGTLREPPPRQSPAPLPCPSLDALSNLYLTSLETRAADSYRLSQAIHLRHLKRHLGAKINVPADRIVAADLEAFQEARLRTRNGNTVCRERNTIRQFFQWAVNRQHLKESPAARLETIKAAVDRPLFRTIAEIEATIKRGGLSEDEQPQLWECLYLNPAEIGQLLQAVRERATDSVSFFLHAIPAYTGMRRGEVLRLRWSDVDLLHRVVIARSRKQSRTKRETARMIDMHPELQREFAAWREQRAKGQFVLCDQNTLQPLDINQANRRFWQPLRGTAWCLDSSRNWFKIGFHTYRHSFASNLASLGVDQRIIDLWMGHQTEAMRKRYRHLFPSIRREAIESFSFSSSPFSTQA